MNERETNEGSSETLRSSMGLKTAIRIIESWGGNDMSVTDDQVISRELMVWKGIVKEHGDRGLGILTCPTRHELSAIPNNYPDVGSKNKQRIMSDKMLLSTSEYHRDDFTQHLKN